MQLQCCAARGYTFLNPRHFNTKRYLFWLNHLRYISLFNPILHTYFTYLYYIPIYHLHNDVDNVTSSFKIFEALFFKNVMSYMPPFSIKVVGWYDHIWELTRTEQVSLEFNPQKKYFPISPASILKHSQDLRF